MIQLYNPNQRLPFFRRSVEVNVMRGQKRYERYQRQIALKNFGEEGQQKLLQAGVVVVGAGGLGCPALQYLVAAGVGKIGIVDDDTVSLHNLHRQVLFTSNDIGLPKTEVAAHRLQEMNPEVQINTWTSRLTNQNALELFKDYHVVVDATDNFTTRYITNDACVLLKKPLVYGAISHFEGQVAVFNYPTIEQPIAVNYRDLFPQAPVPGSVLNCAEAGVLGVLPGIIGTMQANEVIKLITGIGKPLANQLLTYNALTNNSYVFNLSARKETASLLPKDEQAFRQTDYEWFCDTSSDVEEIDSNTFRELLQKTNAVVIDVREVGEQPAIDEFKHLRIPLSQLNQQLPSINSDTVVLFCQSGKRSREAAKILSTTFGVAKKIYSLKDGIVHWKQQLRGKEKA